MNGIYVERPINDSGNYKGTKIKFSSGEEGGEIKMFLDINCHDPKGDWFGRTLYEITLVQALDIAKVFDDYFERYKEHKESSQKGY